jgi:outer membrane lipoprotein SlyB
MKMFTALVQTKIKHKSLKGCQNVQSYSADLNRQSQAKDWSGSPSLSQMNQWMTW